MKNHRFDRYLYMGITAVLVLAAATAVIFLFLEPCWRFYFRLYTTAGSGLRASCWERK